MFIFRVLKMETICLSETLVSTYEEAMMGWHVTTMRDTKNACNVGSETPR
jgi:hypothetical protein